MSECSDVDDCESATCIASLECSEGAAHDDGASGHAFYTEHFAYTWHNVNVHTSGFKLRRRGFWPRRRHETAADRQGKHILQNGESSLRRTSLFVISSGRVNEMNRKSHTGCFFNAEMRNAERAASSLASVQRREVPL